MKSIGLMVCVVCVWLMAGMTSAQEPTAAFQKYCYECHSAETQEGTLNLATLSRDLAGTESRPRWIKAYDRLQKSEMPPRGAEQPDPESRQAMLQWMKSQITQAEQNTADQVATLRRLTRREYENTIRDLFNMPGIALAGDLPADGSAHGFDKHPDALDISHVNISRYLDAADHVLDYAIATRPQPPSIQTRRISLVNRGGFVAHVVMNGDGVLLKNKLPDPDFPPAADQNHLDQGAHERMGSFANGATVGLFRHEDESFNPYLIEHVKIYPGRYRVRTSLWSFQWDKGAMLPGRRTETGRLSVVQLTGDGRGGQHPSYVLGYFDAPDTHAMEHEVAVWLNRNEIMGFNTASLAPAANYARPGRAMAFTGPGIAMDWLDIEGPLYESWPPHSHKVVFGDLPLAEFVPAEHEGVKRPERPRHRQLGAGQNRPDPEPGIWTVHSETPLRDADRLLGEFLPKLFRRPVSDEVRQQYVVIVEERLQAGDCFETAMRAACRSAMVSPDFLYHVEPEDGLDGYALACRLSYFLWNSQPDEKLIQHAADGSLHRADVLHAEVERLLNDPRSARFVEDFTGQWLKLYDIAATDPDRKLYPEFSPWLQDSMVAETRAYFRELLDGNLDASHLVASDFLMVNEKLATHYGIEGVSGSAIRRIPRPQDCPRGGFITHASILKITANGTTTSPVPRGAFVMDRIFGQPPEPPPANVAAIEPDVRGATTIREQLQKHRDNPACATCHMRMDPPGFALEAFDVIGGFRDRYRSIGDGDPAERGSIDPFLPISFRLGPAVESDGQLPDGRGFQNVHDYQTLASSDVKPLLENLARRLLVYSTGRAVRFSDRDAVALIVDRTQERGGGLRTLIHEVVASRLFNGQDNGLPTPEDVVVAAADRVTGADAHRVMMSMPVPKVENPAVRVDEQVSEPMPVPKFEFDAEHEIDVRVAGLFMPYRTAEFEQHVAQIPEARVVRVDFETATARIAWASQSELLRNASPEQVIERISNLVRQRSEHTMSILAPSSIPRDQLQLVELPIAGLDCTACSFAAYEILNRVDGVEQATADFGERLARAWIDPSRTSRDALVETLKSRGVTLVDATEKSK